MNRTQIAALRWESILSRKKSLAKSGGGNPNHDPHNGEFASDGGSGGGAAASGGGGDKPHDSSQESSKLTPKQAAQVKSPEFKRWFGNSKLVDKTGEPLILYHATDADFTEFNLKFSRANDIKGFYFGTDKTPHVTVGDRKNVLACYIKMENPASMEDVQRIARTGVRSPQLAAALKKEGYDGIYNPKDKMVIAFNPQQIKSATHNAGSFNPISRDINKSLSPDARWEKILERAASL